MKKLLAVAVALAWLPAASVMARDNGAILKTVSPDEFSAATAKKGGGKKGGTQTAPKPKAGAK
jgi:hypothetical protein